jgi:parallel beta-helix repeat protein
MYIFKSSFLINSEELYTSINHVKIEGDSLRGVRVKMKTKIRRILGGWASVVMIITVAFFVVVSPRASAGISVGGYIDRDTTWTPELSPYWVESDVIVRNGATLTIENGVDVLFNGYYSIYIEVGAMLRINKHVEPRPYALFSSNFSIKSIGNWRAIQFNDSSYDQSILRDSIIEYATYGIRLESASPTIHNNTIRNCTYGIYSNYGCPTIDNNTIENCIEDGINISGNDPIGRYNTHIEYNTVYNNTNRGIVFYDVSSARLRNNSIASSSYNFGVWGDTQSEFDHDIDDSNTVEQKPIYYWRNHEHDDETIPSDAGYVGIVNSTNVTAEDLTLTHNGHGMLVAYSNYTRIDNVTATNHELGVILYSSPYNTIENSNISNNDYNGYYPLGHGASGIYLQSSLNNNITGNNISSNIRTGIYIADSSSNNITSNNALSNNWCGIDIFTTSNNNSITDNNLSLNDYNGIHIDNSNDNNVMNNTINSNTEYGIPIINSSYRNNIIGNMVLNNEDGVFLSSSGNSNINNNTISNSIYNGIGLLLTSGNNIESNNILNNDCGINSIFLSFNNNITNNNILNNENGIYLPSSWNNNISFCNISSNDLNGIYLTGNYLNEIFANTITRNNRTGINCTSSSDPTIKSNDIENNTWYGVWSEGGSDPVINYNNICNNGGGSSGPGYGVFNKDSGVEIDAQHNWWNDADGPTGQGPGDDGDKVSRWVDYDPYSIIQF